MELALLALLGVGLLSVVFGDSGGEEPDPEPQDVTAELEGGEDIITGAGNDTITGDGGAISTGAGDDVIDMDGQVDGNVDAGSGDDDISASGYGDRIDGGDGNDTLTARIGDATSFYGGDGDDLFQMTRYTNDEGSRVDGGAGDDRIEIRIGRPDEYDDLTLVAGGEGADDFLLEVEPLGLIETDAFPDRTTIFDPVTITDFDSTEDFLEITLLGAAPVIGEPFNDAEFVDVEVIEDANGSQVVLNFVQPYDEPDVGEGVQAGQFIIRLPGATGVDPASIRVLVEA